MGTTKQRKRVAIILSAGAVLTLALGFVLIALQNQIVFFKTPSDLVREALPPDQKLRIGGLVKEQSLKRNGTIAIFEVTDTKHDVRAEYHGILPDLFREGQGIVADGVFKDGVFIADRVLAKHDETYMPKEVAEALRAEGVWRGTEE